MRKWKDILYETIIPVAIFVVPISLVLGITMWVFTDHSDKPKLHIPATGCLFRIETNDTPEFFTEVFVDGGLRIIIDDEEYWIKIERRD